MTMNGADVLVGVLRDWGVSFVSTLCGNGLDSFYVACRRAGLRLIDTRNEQAAAYIADAYARLTGRLAVCAVSSSVGLASALVGVMNAWFDGSPLVILTGESPAADTGRGKFQEFDQVALARPVTKLARLIDRPDQIAFHTHEALRVATSGRPGPVSLTIPVDVLQAPAEPARGLFPPRTPARPQPPGAASPQALIDAVRLLRQCRRPLLVAGTGLFYAHGAPALHRLATRFRIPVVVPIWDRGTIDHPADYFLGVVGAASGQPPVLSQADLLLLVGAAIDYRLHYADPSRLAAGAKLIRIDIDPARLSQGTTPDVALLGDPALVLTQLADDLEQAGAASFDPWLAEAQTLNRRFRARWRQRPPEPAPPMTGRHLIDALRPVLTDDTVLLIDGGNIGQWAHMALADRYPGHWLTCGASAVVGWGLAGAIGARLAFPHRPVILLSGDGALGFTLTDLNTAVKHDTPFVVVLADDQAWGIVVSGQRRAYGEEGVLASRLTPIRYDQVAEALGAIGLRAETPEAIEPALRKALGSGRPALVHVPITVLGPGEIPE